MKDTTIASNMPDRSRPGSTTTALTIGLPQGGSGDFNAKIGSDAYNDWAGTVGQYGTGDTNDRGLRLLEFACSQRLTIANALYPHKLSRRTTWHAPNGRTHNQIDFVLTPRRFKSSINRAKTRTYPGADIGSDHDLVLLTMKMKLKKKHQAVQPRIKFDLEKLKDPEIEEVFQAQLGGRFAALSLLDNNINDLTNTFNEAVRETAEEVLGRQRKKHQPWISNDILDLCDKRRSLKKTKNTSPNEAAQYRETNKLQMVEGGGGGEGVEAAGAWDDGGKDGEV
ncbi:uncharacterized protein LOC143277407 [Babylonia areolata]|uniref:uncharacterized protein LOC143277407 n=1 Tax=Babylonia areolata TaxID=304850 RepID=UPI003FD42416